MVNLCYDTVLKLTEPIVFTAHGQKLVASNYNAKIVAADGSPMSTLIKSRDFSNITLQGFSVSGRRPALGRIEGGGAAIEVGGNASNINITSVNCANPRGRTCLNLYGDGGCKNAVVYYGDYFLLADASAITLSC